MAVTEAERELTKQRIQQWTDAAPVLQALRDEEVRRSDTAVGIQQLAGVAAMTLHDMPPRQESGLIEQQDWFVKLRTHDRTR